MLRDIDVQFVSSTFPNSVTPSLYATLAKRNQINVLHALIHTALWTRSPLLTGLQLADYWAWLRYGWAVGTSSDLRLRAEWDDIDPHQKTILSDEFAIGAITYLLADSAGFQDFVDTLFVVRTGKPTKVKLGRTGKRGPSKAPDYIALDGNNQYLPLECKGTQSSRAVLGKAMVTGVAQKQNATGKVLGPGLVAGLFIPQHSSADLALVEFRDPTWRLLDRVVDRMGPEMLALTVLRGSLAKQLDFIGADLASHELTEHGFVRFSKMAKEQLTKFERKTLLFNSIDNRTPQSIPRARVSVSVDARTISALSTDSPLAELNEARSPAWQHIVDNGAAIALSPLGVCISLEAPDFGES